MGFPALSVVLVIGRMRQRAERSLKAILEQETEGPIEVLVVDTTPEKPRIRGGEAPNVVYLEYPDAPSFAHTKLFALSRVSADRVAFVEDHVFVEPGWASAVLKGFETGADVVVYTYRDATPESVYSRAFGLLAYGRWMSERLAGERPHGPGNNVAYRKDALLRQGGRLEDLMHVEFFLHRALREQGGKIYQEATARVAHANWDNLRGALWDTCMGSRLFAHQRRILEKPSLLKRLFYAGAMPLLPLLLFWRYCKALKGDPELLSSYLRHSPVILFLVFCSGISEAIGYLDSSPRYRRQLDTEVTMPRACD
jgi:hypothetical protein